MYFDKEKEPTNSNNSKNQALKLCDFSLMKCESGNTKFKTVKGDIVKSENGFLFNENPKGRYSMTNF